MALEAKKAATKTLVEFIDSGFDPAMYGQINEILDLIETHPVCFCSDCRTIVSKLDMAIYIENTEIVSRYKTYKKYRNDYVKDVADEKTFMIILDYFLLRKKDFSHTNPHVQKRLEYLIEAIRHGNLCKQTENPSIMDKFLFLKDNSVYVVLVSVLASWNKDRISESIQKLKKLFVFDDPVPQKINRCDARFEKTLTFMDLYWRGLKPDEIAELELIYGRGPLFENGTVVTLKERIAWETLVQNDYKKKMSSRKNSIST